MDRDKDKHKERESQRKTKAQNATPKRIAAGRATNGSSTTLARQHKQPEDGRVLVLVGVGFPKSRHLKLR